MEGEPEGTSSTVGRVGPGTLLTWGRMGVAVLLVGVMAATSPAARLLAVCLFAVGVATDALDGFLARREGHAGLAGARADLLADQLLVSGPLVLLPLYGVLPAWSAWSLLGGGWLVLMLRYKQGAGFRACAAGRTMTALVMAAVGAGLLARAAVPVSGALPALMVLALVTVGSAAVRYLLLGVGGYAPETRVVPPSAKQVAIHLLLAPVAALLAVYMLVVYLTMRMKVVGRENDGLAEEAGTRRLYVALHGRSMTTLARHRGRGMAVLAGINATGAVGAMMTALLGYAPIRLDVGGRRSAVEAAQKMTEWVEAGGDACLLVDGPYGPAGEPKPLAVSIARRTGARLVPVVSDATPSIVLRKRWDQFQMPLPFCRAVAVYGAPVTVAGDVDAAEAEAVRLRLAAALQEAQRTASDALSRPD